MTVIITKSYWALAITGYRKKKTTATFCSKDGWNVSPAMEQSLAEI